MSDTVPIPPQGSLGLLAAGHVALRAWRAARGPEWAAALVPLEVQGTPTPRNVQAREVPPAEDLSGLVVVVVSGLPRSGTSMMMQMLVAGGVSPFSDGARAADENNPRGFFEHEAVKRLQRDATWLPLADRRAVKVVTPLLSLLPPGPTYRIVHLDRDLDAIVESQATMLARLGTEPADREQLKASYQSHLDTALRWAHADDGVELLRVAHADVLEAPTREASRVAEFVGPALALDLDPTAMAAAVDPSLHRHRPA